MKGSAVVALCAVLVVTVSARPEEEKYTDQYDDIDIDEILRSDRLLDNYFMCLKTGKRCTPEGHKLKEILPDALKTGCSKCTDVQKVQGRKVIHFMAQNKPAMFKELEALFDPTHEYRKQNAEKLKAEGIILPD